MGSDNLNMDSGSVKGIGTKFGIAGGIVLSISVAILTKKLLNFSAISVGLEVIGCDNFCSFECFHWWAF